MMEDSKIIELYWLRDESAIHATSQKYGAYLFKIAYNILADSQDSEESVNDTYDSEESVNDTYLKAWNSMPPHRPDLLAAFLGKITRELSIDRLRWHTRQKRAASGYAPALAELEECVSGQDSAEDQAALRLLAEAIGAYLRSLAPEARNIFVGRYFYLDSIRETAAYYGISESKAKSLLHRTRKGLKAYLEKEGFLL